MEENVVRCYNFQGYFVFATSLLIFWTISWDQNNLFVKLYLGHANRIITGYVEEDKHHKISRERIEMQILEGIDNAEFPIAYRIAWISLVVHTNTFDIYWLGQQDLHGLSKSAIYRLEPDTSLMDDIRLSSPSPCSSISSRESSPASIDAQVVSVSDDDATTETGQPITETETIEAPPPSPTKRASPRKRAPPRPRATTAGKKPAGIRKQRAPAKKPKPLKPIQNPAGALSDTENADQSLGQGMNHEAASNENSNTGTTIELDSSSNLPDPSGGATTTTAPAKAGGKKKTVRFDLPEESQITP
ncbi:hypothetical protein FQN50_004350 [Emmonsiellopsis sp. PD_5]|nr:hypothetical protein FQN50_004350 [Emmonsiellopsis sp. PD_5]